jgi:hypothetical protein
MPMLRNLDWQRTIRSNLKGWDAERQRLVPERIHFWANQRRRHEWDVVLVVDQSGSMARTCVYASVMAAIFASLDVLRTRMVLYDTEVVDVSHLLHDPVEILFTAQLGGGNDGKRALAYAIDQYVERPEKTLFLWITDLGSRSRTFRRSSPGCGDWWIAASRPSSCLRSTRPAVHGSTATSRGSSRTSASCASAARPGSSWT